LPTSINKLERLKRINLHGNRINYYEELCKLVGLDSLEHLGLRYNDFKYLPPCISNLKTLRSIDVSQNYSFRLSANIALLSTLPELESLDIGNRDGRLPSNIIQLKNLKSLDLSYTRNLDLKRACRILSNMNVQHLSLSNCSLDEVPSNIQLLCKLKSLYLGDNYISTLPKNIESLSQLEYLDLGGNKNLKELPAEIYLLKKLKTLNLYGIELTSNQLLELKLNLPNCEIISVPYQTMIH